MLPEFDIITSTGAVRETVSGWHNAVRLSDWYTRQDMIPHTVRPVRKVAS